MTANWSWLVAGQMRRTDFSFLWVATITMCHMKGFVHTYDIVAFEPQAEDSDGLKRTRGW